MSNEPIDNDYPAGKEQYKPDTMSDNNKFKVLKYSWMYVDINRLGKGIYQTMIPYLYPPDHTIEKIIQTHKEMQKYSGMTDEYIAEVEKNLKECRMVDVILYECESCLHIIYTERGN